MKTKFLYLLIIVFAVSLTSCKKQKAKKGLVGTWDITSEEGSGIFHLGKKGKGYITILNNSTNELIHDIQINNLKVTSHIGGKHIIWGESHFYQGQFYTRNGNYAYFQLSGSGNGSDQKVDIESQELEMDISFYDGDNNSDAPWDFDLDIIMTRQ